MVAFSKLLLVLSCSIVVTACGGSPSSPAPQTPSPPTVSSGEGLAGTPDQPFAQRVAKTPYPTSSLLKDSEAMKRILGPDLDQNGIRDDVDALIATLTTDPLKLKAYQQYARTIQNGFLVGVKAEAYANSAQSVRALKCVSKVAKANGESDKTEWQNSIYLQNIGKLTVNTYERMIRSEEVDVLSHGVTFSFGGDEDLSNVCD